MKTVTPDTAWLEEHVDELASQLKIKPTVWTKFRGYLEELKHHNQAMYDHSLRVGIYAHGLAAFEHQSDLKLPLYGGCGHDLGKCRVSNLLLNAEHLSNRGFERIKPHAAAGFNRLKDDFLFTAFIAGLHHKLKDGGYGIDLDRDSPRPLSRTLKRKIYDTASLVMLTDFFDALTTRHNDKGLINDPDNDEQVLEVMDRWFPEQGKRNRWLVANRLTASKS